MDKNIQFGEEQLAAISKLENFIGGTDLTITLSGSAGTGKTTLILELIKLESPDTETVSNPQYPEEGETDCEYEAGVTDFV